MSTTGSCNPLHGRPLPHNGYDLRLNLPVDGPWPEPGGQCLGRNFQMTFIYLGDADAECAIAIDGIWPYVH
jgi:hypothetical protein